MHVYLDTRDGAQGIQCSTTFSILKKPKTSMDSYIPEPRLALEAIIAHLLAPAPSIQTTIK